MKRWFTIFFKKASVLACILFFMFNATVQSSSSTNTMYASYLIKYATYLNTPHEYNSANKVFIDSHGNYYIAVTAIRRLLYICEKPPPDAYTTKSSNEELESHYDCMTNIYKFTPSHELLWKSMLSSDEYISVEDITLSEDESYLYVTGEIRAYSDFLPTFTTIYNKESLSEDKTNVFVVKMDSDGHVHSSVIIGGESWDSPYAICIFNDAVYIAGETSSMKFLTTHGERNESSEGFLCSFSLDTLELKTSQYFGGKYSDGIRDIFATKDHLYITGSTSSSSLPGCKERVSGGHNSFVSCLLPSGEVAWTRFVHIGACTWMYAGTLDSKGNIILCGYTTIARSESFTYLYPPDDDDLYRVGCVSIFTPTGEHISTTGYNKSVFQDVTVSGNSIFATGNAWKGFFRPNEEELPESQSFSSCIQLTSEGKHMNTWITGGGTEKWLGDSGLGIAWNPSKHSIVVVGQTQSKDIPCTDNALQRNPKNDMEMNAYLVEYYVAE